MQQPAKYRSKRKGVPPGHHPNEVYVLRDWKEYIGESLLIIFSVLLALGLTEFINQIHEKNQTRDMVRNIRDELIRNRKNAQEQYQYQKLVLKNIDSALHDQNFALQIFTRDRLILDKVAPNGIVYRDLDDVAWQVAKSQNIAAHLDFATVAVLTDIYDNQARITKLEDEVAGVLLNPQSRVPANVHTTLVLMRDNYHGWAFDRTPALLNKYDDAIKMLAEKD